MTDEMTFTWYSTARDILCNLADFDLDDPGRLHILDNQIALIAALPPGGLYDRARSQLRSLLASVRQMLLAEGALAAQEALRNDCANYEAKARADGREHEIAIKDHETADLRADRSQGDRTRRPLPGGCAEGRRDGLDAAKVGESPNGWS
jgi:hypothetical protein